MNTSNREHPTHDEEWFDLRSLAPAEDAAEPSEALSAPRSRAYYAPSPDAPSGPEPRRPGPASGATPRSRFRDTYGPVLFFAFLGMTLVVSVVLFLVPYPEPAPEEPTSDVHGEAQPVAPLPAASQPAAAELDVALRVESNPDGALVYVDGALAGVTPFRDDAAEPGWRTISLEKPGHAVRDTLLFVDSEATTTLALALEPLEEVRAVDAAPEPEPPAPTAGAGTTPDAGQEAAAPETGALRVETTPARAVVRLDGTVVGRTPLVLGDLAPGLHEITLSLPGYASHTRRVDVGPGRRATVRATLAAGTGTLSVLVHPWGSIYVDGTLLARDTDLRRSIDVAAGPHVVRVEHPVLGAQQRTVEVRAGQTTSVDFDLL